MAKELLQLEIGKSDGAFIFSDGTLNPTHLLPKVYDLLVAYDIEDAKHGIGDLKTSILEVFIPDSERFDSMDEVLLANGKSLYNAQYYGCCKLIDYRHGDIALSPSDVWSAAFDFFESLAPDGYYFGSQEGDGACIGWFTFREEDGEVEEVESDEV